MKSNTSIRKQIETSIRCNVGHSGNHRLTYSVGYYECSGCGHFHAPESCEAELSAKPSDLDGAGGVIRRAKA